jgi:hypothetical protein
MRYFHPPIQVSGYAAFAVFAGPHAHQHAIDCARQLFALENFEDSGSSQ